MNTFDEGKFDFSQLVLKPVIIHCSENLSTIWLKVPFGYMCLDFYSCVCSK